MGTNLTISGTVRAPDAAQAQLVREGGQSAQGIAAHPVVSRASAVFVRNFLQDAAIASGGDFIDAMIRMAITEANVRHLLADDAENRRFASFDQPVPDDLRRPVSVHGVSTSLSMPFETVRRRVGRLSKRDLCSLVPGGLIVTQAQLSTEAMRVHGGYGYSEEFDVERYYRDAPLMCIGEGTNEIQRVLIARELVKRFPA